MQICSCKAKGCVLSTVAFIFPYFFSRICSNFLAFSSSRNSFDNKSPIFIFIWECYVLNLYYCLYYLMPSLILPFTKKAVGTKENIILILSEQWPLSTKEIFYRLLKHNKTKKLLIPMPTFLAKFIFYIFSDIFKMAAPDQMLRLLSKKEPLSGNVLTDLNVKPRYFLK